MRKLLVTLTAAGTALAFAAPASAQWYPQQGYGNRYANGYGFNDWGQARAMQTRIDSVQRQIDTLARRNRIRGDSAGHLMQETRDLEWRLRSASRNGLDPYEANDVQRRIALIERRVQYAAAMRYGYGNQGWTGDRGYYGGDRFGRNDRYDDGGWRGE